jgi:hypothetical protein
MKSCFKFFIFAMLGVVMAGCTALAQQKTQGEMQRITTTIQMQGMSIPAQTMEVCVPAGDGGSSDPVDALRQNGYCQISNVNRSGNKISLDMKCKEPAMEGHMELETTGNTTRGTMTMKMEGQTMTTRYEITKLGKSCDVAAPKSAASPAKS